MSREEYRKKLFCRSKDTEETKAPETSNLEDFAQKTCGKCGCEVCECVKKNIFDPGDKRKLYSCTHCGFKASYAETLSHTIAVHKKHLYPCTKCHFETSLSQQLRLHMVEHGEYFCVQCEFKTSSHQGINQHLKSHSDEPYLSSAQGKFYKASRKVYSNRHVKANAKQTSFSFNKCEFETDVCEKLEKHKQCHSLVEKQQQCNKETSYSCSRCKFKTTDLQVFNVHMTGHKQKGPFFCPNCEHKAENLKRLNTHIKFDCHEKPYPCERCDFTALNLSELMNHVKTHNQQGSTTYSCTHCDYESVYEANLIRHMRIHKRTSCAKCVSLLRKT